MKCTCVHSGCTTAWWCVVLKLYAVVCMCHLLYAFRLALYILQFVLQLHVFVILYQIIYNCPIVYRRYLFMQQNDQNAYTSVAGKLQSCAFVLVIIVNNTEIFLPCSYDFSTQCVQLGYTFKCQIRGASHNSSKDAPLMMALMRLHSSQHCFIELIIDRFENWFQLMLTALLLNSCSLLYFVIYGDDVL